MSSNGSHLFGCHGSTGEPWVGGFKTSHPAKEKKMRAPQAQYQECPPHTVTQSAHTSQQTRVYPYSSPGSRCSVCFELGEGRPPLEKGKMLRQKEKEGKKMGGTATATAAELHDCFHLNVTGLSFSPSPHYLRPTPELHLCLECFCTGSCPLPGMFCKGSSLIITVNTLLHTFLLPLVFRANNAAAEACSIEAVMADSYNSWIASTSLPTRPDWLLAKQRLKLIFN